MYQSVRHNRGSGDDSPESHINRGESSPPIEVTIPRRRSFTAAWKRNILAEVDGAPHGGIGRILRREGITYAHIQAFRVQLRRGSLIDSDSGRKSKAALERENRDLLRENTRLRSETEKLEIIVEFQSRLGDMLGEPRRREKPS